MKRIKEEIIVAEISEKEKQSPECCMCGDYGLTFELFRCKVCENKSQHRYCSVQYPKSDSYEICNWCLSQKIDTVDNKVENSNSSSLSQKMEDDQTKIKGRRGTGRGGGDDDRPQTSPTGEKKKGLAAVLKLKLINKTIKKSKSPPPQESPQRPPAARKMISLSGSGDKEMLRRTRSEEGIQKSNSTIMRKHMYKNKVRRYKLLDEVSC